MVRNLESQAKRAPILSLDKVLAAWPEEMESYYFSLGKVLSLDKVFVGGSCHAME